MRVAARGEEHYDAVLVLIVATLAAAPFESSILRPLIIALLGVIFVFALWTSGSPRVLVLLSIGFAAAGVIAAASTDVASGRTSRLAYTAIGLMACAGTIVAIGRRLRWQPRITRRTVTGALSVYLLIGLLFAYLFGFIGVLKPAGFFAQPGQYDAVSFLYFSFITLTTVGYGDLTAGNDVGRMLTAVEALIGQLYLVTVVAIVIGNIGRERSGHRRKPDSGRRSSAGPGRRLTENTSTGQAAANGRLSSRPSPAPKRR